MKFLSDILQRAAHSSSSGTRLIPYMSLQKYFQLFVGGIHTLTDNPSMDALAVKIPGQFLKFYDCEEGDDFFSPETSFTTIGEYNNAKGGHIYHGEYVTHGKDGGAMEYIYIVMASSTPTENPAQRGFTPHFVYLGGRISGDAQELVYSSFVLARTGYDGEKSNLVNVDPHNLAAVISALAYADIPFKKILVGEEIDADTIAAAFSLTDISMHVEKFSATVNGRTPHTLTREMSI